MNIPRILELARQASLKSDHFDHKLGAVLVDRKGRVYSASPNYLFKTHPIYDKISPLRTLHAEAAAILKIRHKTDFSKLQLFVYRELKNGTLANSRPCDGCMELIKRYGINTVWYTHSEGIKKEIL